MQNKLKKRINRELKNYLQHLNTAYALNRLSPLLFKSIKNFILRKGKRLRPLLFVVGYLGFAKRPAANLYKSALSIELLHDFMLIHDDIIDKSDSRRGQPSMHQMLAKHLNRFKGLKFTGQDLAIVAGDMMYAMAIDTFLSIKEEPQRKEKALGRFIQATVYTAIGEFIELLGGVKDISQVSKKDIYKIYDYKTAHYTFASPLSMGAILAGAPEEQAERLHRYGIYLGRAFQIKDDILGLFSTERKIGKSTITDLQEAKKTLLVWYAYRRAAREDRRIINRIFTKRKVFKSDLLKMRQIVRTTGSLDYARKEIAVFIKKAQDTIKVSSLRAEYKSFLNSFSQNLLCA